ncbi:MAG: glycosyltransferase family 39 protein [Deltaproteobacteria bacterium]|nr:glycosyltransferase family 39 protein [Deltaproteobacteria bacterium]
MGKKSREKRQRIRPDSAADGAAVPKHSAPQPAWLQETVAPAAGATTAWWIPISIGLVAFAVRGFFLSQVSHTPYLEVDNIDAKGYQVWANQILGGEWLPHRHFYQSPLYAYYLAIVYALFGSGPWAPRLIQIVAGSGSVVLLYFIGRRLFSQRVGIIAALMMAIYGPMVIEEIMLAKTSLVIFSVLVALTLYLRALSRDDVLTMFTAGAVFGLSVIGVGQWLVCWLLLVGYTLLPSQLATARRSILAAAFLAGGVIFIAPIAAWNSYWGSGLMLTSGDAGLNAFVGNNPLATGLPGRPANLRDVPEFEEADSKNLAERDAGHSLTPAGVSAHWSHRALSWALENPSAFVTTTLQKLTVLWNAYEIPDSYHYAFVREVFIAAFWGCLTLALIGPLAIVGMVLVASHKPARPLYIVCFAYLATILLIYVRARYRIPAIPFLILFAAATLDWMITAVALRHWSSLIATGIAVCAAAAFVNHQYCEPARDNIPAICLSGDTFFDLEWMKLAEWDRDHNDLQHERDHLELALRTSSPRGPGQLNFWFADAEYRMGQSLQRSGQSDAARTHYESAERAYQRALGRKYRVAQVNNNLALVYRDLGREDRAVQAIDAARQAQPSDPNILRHGLRLNVDLGRCAEARHWADELEKKVPGDHETQQLLSRCVSR